MSTKSKGVSAEVTKVQNLIAGAQKNLIATSNLVVLGATMLVSAIITKLQGYLTLEENVGTTQAAYRAAVAARKEQEADVKTFVDGFISVLKATFGPGNPVLQSFGIAPPKTRKQLTAEEKATAAAIGKQTKVVRGPIGKNQRANVTVDGKPGMVFKTATGEEIPGATKGPIAPAVAPAPAPSSTPAEPAPANGSGNGSTK
ncbi:MAG: hypothetical protein ACYDCL_14425 [Myxococcales bacterium]